jgi:hypothetical protein
MADDVLVLQPREPTAPPLAHPGPPLMTVPTRRLATLEQRLSAHAGGRAGCTNGHIQTISALAQERWIAVPVHPDPLPLAAVLVLNRHPGLPTRLRRADRPLTAVLGSLLRFPRERERGRFEMAGAIAAHAPIWTLDADPGVEPEALANLLQAELAEPVSAWSPT